MNDSHAAIATARRSLTTWSAAPACQRADVLTTCAEALEARSDDLAAVLAAAHARPVRQTREVDLPAIVWSFRHAAGRARGWQSQQHTMAPVGVCVVLDGGSHARQRVSLHLAAAIGSGNCVVWATAPDTSQGALLVRDICLRAGLPPGVFHVVGTDDPDMAAVAGAADVDSVTCLTGQAQAHRAALSAASGGARFHLVPEPLDAFVVLADADIDSAAEALANTITAQAGRASEPTRLLVQEALAEDTLARFGRRLARLKVGEPLDPLTDLVIPDDESTALAVNRAVREGSQLVGNEPVEGERGGDMDGNGEHERGDDLGGIRATTDGAIPVAPVLTDVAPASEPHLTQTDGRVVVAATFRALAEAVSLLPSTEAGLSTSVWGEEIGPALEIARACQAPSVFVNGSRHEPGAGAPPMTLLTDLFPDPVWTYVRSVPERGPQQVKADGADDSLEDVWLACLARAACDAGSARDLGVDGLVIALPHHHRSVGLILDPSTTAGELAALAFPPLALGSRVVLHDEPSTRTVVDAVREALHDAGGPTASMVVVPRPADAGADPGTDAGAAPPPTFGDTDVTTIWFVGTADRWPSVARAAAAGRQPVWPVTADVDLANLGGSGEREILHHALWWKVIVL